MRLVSPALKHIVFPALSHSGYLRRHIGEGPAVVTYHGVFPPGYDIRSAALDGNLVSAKSFQRQLHLLKKRYHVVAPRDFLRWIEGEIALPSHSVLLTCDDALRNTLSEMVPVLRSLNLSCLFFATGASAAPAPSMLWYEELYLMLLDATEPVRLNLSLGPSEDQLVLPSSAGDRKLSHWWNLMEWLSQFSGETRRQFLDEIRRQLRLSESWAEKFVHDSTLAARFLSLDLAGLRQLAAAGMTVGAHSLSHPILAKASPELARQEISESRRVLEAAFGETIWAFAYPFGNAATMTRREIRLAEQAGFRCAFTNVGGGFGAPRDRFAFPRVHVTADMTLSEFEAHLSGCYRRLREKLLGSSDEPIPQTVNPGAPSTNTGGPS